MVSKNVPDHIFLIKAKGVLNTISISNSPTFQNLRNVGKHWSENEMEKSGGLKIEGLFVECSTEGTKCLPWHSTIGLII